MTTQPQTLPADSARCYGNGDKQCADCLRRTAPHDTLVWITAPPAFVGDCPIRIPAKDGKS
jgi:hypothetical protein